MDKVERVLFLFWQLYSGVQIDKMTFCFEMGIDTRTFERDLAAVRNFLAESYLGQEIVFDRLRNIYYMKGYTRQILNEVEYTTTAMILRGSKALRADEMEGLLGELKKVSEYSGVQILENLSTNPINNEKRSPTKALLKMLWDLLKCIELKVEIQILYFNNDGRGEKILIVPLNVYYEDSGFRLRAVLTDSKTYSIYKIEQIDSFEIMRKINIKEQQQYF